MKSARILGTATAVVAIGLLGAADVRANTAAPAPVATPPVAVAAAPAGDAPATRPQPRRVPQGPGHVYLVRGLLNVFSLGMDDLAVKMNARGMSATVHEHGGWELLADRIIARHAGGGAGPIVLVGHSLGADAVVLMAERIARAGVPVPLVVTFDPVEQRSVGAGTLIINYFQSNNGWGKALRPGPGYRGTIQNVDLAARGDLTHTSIDKAHDLHMLVMQRAAQAGVGRGRAVPAAVAGQPRPETSARAVAPRPAAAPASAAAPAAAQGAPTPAAPAPATTATTPATSSASAENEIGLRR